MAKVLDELYYTEDHEWLRVDGNVGFVGITDFAQGHLGDIAYIELPDAGSRFAAGEVFGVVESIKTASDLLMPVSGTVAEKNDSAEQSPEKVNADAYDSWLIKIELEDMGELDKLLRADAYTELTKE
ncbi:MAG: glycine cleavage system protein GcvH [Clostridiales Family XIII bacterium]|jgi:glycine cleavage system H protein|nr:glycine cleavage system protein GcvH [Clostridiales Family XIII bacterium]